MDPRTKRASWQYIAATGAVAVAFVSGYAARSAAGPQTLPPPPLERPIASTESAALADQAIGLVNEARSSGHWAVADRDKLRELSRRLTADQYDQVLRWLVRALNVGELQADFVGPPM